MKLCVGMIRLMLIETQYPELVGDGGALTEDGELIATELGKALSKPEKAKESANTNPASTKCCGRPATSPFAKMLRDPFAFVLWLRRTKPASCR